MRWFLISTIILTFISIIFIYFDWDRKLKLKLTSLNSLTDIYSLKPKNKSNRVVALIKCSSGLCNDTIKTLLDQSIRLHDIAVETEHPEYINDEFLKVVSIHKPGTLWLRETDRDTIIIEIENGKEYPYDYIENEVDRIKGN
jgi:hypothetical protein